MIYTNIPIIYKNIPIIYKNMPIIYKNMPTIYKNIPIIYKNIHICISKNIKIVENLEEVRFTTENPVLWYPKLSIAIAKAGWDDWLAGRLALLILLILCGVLWGNGWLAGWSPWVGGWVAGHGCALCGCALWRLRAVAALSAVDTSLWWLLLLAASPLWLPLWHVVVPSCCG